MHRRSFLTGSGVVLLSAAGGLPLVGCRAWMRRDTRREQADAHQFATLSAMAVAFLPPGDGTPGAREANAIAVIADPAYGVSGYLSEVVSDLDDWCMLRFDGKHFLELDAAGQELALEQRMGEHGSVKESLYKPVYEGILALTKLAFFGALSNPVGTNFVGFPGPSLGYAPTSAAGAWHAADTPRALGDGVEGATSTITVDGDGKVSALRVTLVVSGASPTRLTPRLTAPDGSVHELPGAHHEPGAELAVHDLAVPAVNGRPAAGAWRLAIAGGKRGAPSRLAFWSFTLRTDLDDAVRT